MSASSYDNPWLYNGEIFDDEQVGDAVSFVYLISNKLTGKSYIGKKTLISRRTKTIKGKKKKTKMASDWKKYYGSNSALVADVKSHGPENFTRQILHLCYNKGTANYLELKEIVARGALENVEMWYNDWIMARIHRSHIKIEEKTDDETVAGRKKT